jgi:hypothetical protein
MGRRLWTALAGLLLSAIALAWGLAGASAQPPVGSDKGGPTTKAADRGKDVFGLTKVWQIHLAFAAKEWDRLQPARGPRFPGAGPPGGFGKGPPKADGPARDVHRSAGGFGMEFPWARADLAAGGKTYKGVGVRYKGNFTYLIGANQLKRPLKIDLAHYVEGQRFLSQKKLNLASGGTDPARSREVLAFAVFRAAGVPAPRTAYAEVTLTVPGKYDREYVGLYVLIEQVGGPFLKLHFKDSSGLLLKPEGLQGGLTYLGEDWKPYEQRYRPKGTADQKQQRRLIDFARLVNRAGDEQFRKEIGAYLDVDAFLRFVAANALIANLDSYLGFGHNYYLYLRPDTNRFVFIPWDVDLSFGMWPPGGPPQQQMDLSVGHPYMGQNRLIERLLAMKGVGERYRDLLKELTATCFTRERLLKDIDAIDKVTAEPLARERRAAAARKEKSGVFGLAGPGGGMFGQAPPLRTFAEKRTASVVAQLAGKSKGYVPAGFGFGGFGPGGPAGFARPGEVLGGPVREQMRLTEAQKKQLADLQKEVDARLEMILNEEQRALLRRLREARLGGPGFGPPGGGFPAVPPGKGRP